MINPPRPWRITRDGVNQKPVNEMETTIRPIRRFVLLLDDQPERTEGGVIVRQELLRRTNLDYTVVRVGEKENVGFGQGDRVVLADPNVGRPVRIDGTVFRLVRVSDIIAVVTQE